MDRKLKYALCGSLAAACAAACSLLFSSAYESGVRAAPIGRARAGISSSSGRASAEKTGFAAEAKAPSVPSAAAHVHALVLVNGSSPIPSWFKTDLTDSFGYRMDRAAAEAFAGMKTDASRDGVSLWISAAYRSGELQGEYYRRTVEECAKTSPTYEDAQALAQRSVAQPGHSEYETGLALDLNGAGGDFGTTAAFRWLGFHAQDYGFILRYPKEKQSATGMQYEPWHYRYVGVPAAQAMKKAGLCLEEYTAQKTDGVH